MTNKNALNELNNRFSKILGGGNYARLLKALPYYMAFQALVAASAKEALRPSKEQHQILDLGCGTGLTSFALGQVLENARITAVDEEPKMLASYTETMAKLDSELQARNVVFGIKKARSSASFVVARTTRSMLWFRGLPSTTFL